MTESLRIPCGPIHSTNSHVPCLVMKGEAQWIKQTPPESILTHPEPSNLMLGPRRGRHCGGMMSIPAAQPCLRSLGKSWQRALSEVLRHSPSGTAAALFFLPGHLLAKPRRKGKGKHRRRGKQKWREGRWCWWTGDRNGERGRLNELPTEAATREPINACCGDAGRQLTGNWMDASHLIHRGHSCEEMTAFPLAVDLV